MEQKRRKDGEQVKREIALQTKELFASKGYAATSMEEICGVTGRSKGSIYYYFKSKDELFLFLVKMHIQDWMLAWAEKEATIATSTEKLYALAEHFAEDFENPLMKVMDEFIMSQAVSQDTLHDMLMWNRASHDMYKELIIEGIERGEFKNDQPEDVMYILQGTLSGLGTLYFELEAEQVKRLYKRSIDLLLTGIAAKD
ncbi:TetR/AcrR family transcriptional regulator [Ectobacillus sp. JY-23]|uniref:TetR/AcrR family transcriptional regulator n=1 Tax=Ectobacillus sp. JY-23 TaxID=2933872 RepID=UPI001FF36AF4|nr:TetR/AcrR family transcriptional regulator [Ectobacillus sp. JY-23]UOY91669.1 TetR/AcrR family transcriptional regulator [Ectobacillus sp. JY-23]